MLVTLYHIYYDITMQRMVRHRRDADMALPAKSVAVLIKEISSRAGVCTSFSGLRGGGLLVAAQRCSEDVAFSLPFSVILFGTRTV